MVNDPGPAVGASPVLASSAYLFGISSCLASSGSSVANGDLATAAFGLPPAAPDGFYVDPPPILPEFPHLSSEASSCPNEKLLCPPG